MSTVYAKVRVEGRTKGNPHYYTKRFLVYDDSGTVGSYGVDFGPYAFSDDGFGNFFARPQDPEFGSYAYGASRDYHRLASESEIAAYQEQQRFYALSDDEQDAYEKEHGWPTAYSVNINGCCYLPDGPCICDGSGLVEVTLDEKRSFEIAHMMSER